MGLELLVMEKVGRVVGCNSGGNPCQVPGPIVIAAVRGPLRVGNGDPVRACAVQADQFSRFSFSRRQCIPEISDQTKHRGSRGSIRMIDILSYDFLFGH